MSTPPLTAARAARHEALHIRLTALLKQIEAVARQKPGAELLPVVRSLAEDLLFEAREFRPAGERRGLPGAAPDPVGLAVQLGQALAMLDRWQAAHAGMNAARNLCWILADGSHLPIQRLHPDAPARSAHRGEDMDDIRDKLTRRIENTIRHGVRERLVALGVDPHVASAQSEEVAEKFRDS